MEAGNKSIYNIQFQGNILVVGKTGCRKTHFVHKLGLNKFFEKIVKTEWVTGIEIDEQREAEIQSCFNDQVKFNLAAEHDELTPLIENFKLRKRDIINNQNNSLFGERISMDHLIVMDNVSGIADNYKKLTVVV